MLNQSFECAVPSSISSVLAMIHDEHEAKCAIGGVIIHPPLFQNVVKCRHQMSLNVVKNCRGRRSR